MSKKASVPSYRKHKQSGQAIVTLSDGHGRRHDVLLGKYGTRGSWQEYARVLAEWEASGRRLASPKHEPAGLSVNEVILAFWEHAKQRYSPSGRELDNFKLSLRPLRKLYGHTSASSFGPKALKVVQKAMASGSWMTSEEQTRARGRGLPVCWCRNVVNRRIARIKTLFKWAESEELVPASTYQGLRTVCGLPKNMPGIRHTDPVEPATQEQIETLLSSCKQPLATMLNLQWLAGMRSAEVRIMRTCDINQSSPGAWFYRPNKHKNAWREKNQQRVVVFGPRCIELLQPFLKPDDPEAFLFQPRQAEAERNRTRRASRRTPVTPSQRARQPKRNRKRVPGDSYSATSYARAVARASDKAGVKVRPYQLRHSAKQRITRSAGLDAARAVLGQQSIGTTNLYASQQDVVMAAEVMARLG
jgi:integrase